MCTEYITDFAYKQVKLFSKRAALPRPSFSGSTFPGASPSNEKKNLEDIHPKIPSEFLISCTDM